MCTKEKFLNMTLKKQRFLCYIVRHYNQNYIMNS